MYKSLDCLVHRALLGLRRRRSFSWLMPPAICARGPSDMTTLTSNRRTVVTFMVLSVLVVIPLGASNSRTYSAPTNVTVSSTVDKHVRVSWDDDGAPIHRVGWAHTADFHPAVAAEDSAEALHFADTKRPTDYVVKHLPAGQEYYFRVRDYSPAVRDRDPANRPRAVDNGVLRRRLRP